jgi:drug/metabolite transporter (DMT)-like permease
VSRGGFVLGIVALQLACLGWALGSSYARRHARGADPLVSAGAQMLCGGLILLAIGSAAGEWPRLAFTARTLWAEIYLTLVGSIGGYTAYVYALRHLPISTVALYAYVNPVIAVLLGSLLLAEPLGPRLLVAFALVMTGVVIVGRGTARSTARR